MAKTKLALVSPATVNRTVGPLRRRNAELRTREHLTAAEVEALIEAAKGNRHGHRDATMMTRGRCKRTLGTGTFSTRSGTPNWPRTVSKTSGGIERDRLPPGASAARRHRPRQSGPSSPGPEAFS